MKRITAYASVMLLLMVLAGCGAAAKKMIADKSQSERTDVFTEISGSDVAPSGYADVFITANIKTHVEGYYSGESRTSLHGKEVYPFLLNIDGQAAVWMVEGTKHELPVYRDGKTSKDPEAGAGIKYVLNRKVRLRAGLHKLFFGLPEEDYYLAAAINVKEGEVQTLEFKPEYKYKTMPTRIPTYMQGVSRYDIRISSSPVAP